jgi:hypothetical protein
MDVVGAGFSLRNEIHNCGNMINWQGRDAHRCVVFSAGEKMDDILPATLIVVKVLGFGCWVLGMDMVGAGFSLRNGKYHYKDMINGQGRDAHRNLVFSAGEKMDDILPAALIVMKVLGFRCWVLGMDVVAAGFSLRNDKRNLRGAATVMINTA